MSRIALQLYTVRQSLEADPSDTLKRVRDCGFEFVETAAIPSNLKPRDFARLIHEHGLRVVSLHAPLPMHSDFGTFLELAQATGCDRVIWHGWPRDARFDSPAGVRELVNEYALAYEVAQAFGLKFGLHTHWWEFEPIEGEYPYQVFARELPGDLFLQVDVYWLRVAGLDPQRVVAELSPRIISLHAKDGPAVHGQPMTAIGEGVIDFEALVRASPKSIDWIIEMDEIATDPFDAAQRSLAVLQSLVTRYSNPDHSR